MRDARAVIALQDWISSHRDEMVQDLSDYIGQETPSDDKNLLIKGLDWTERWLGLRLGAPAARRMVDGGDHGDTVVVDYPSPTLPAAPWVTALCHYDTVWQAGTLAEWPVSVEGDALTGPGAFDMKAGLVQAVWALKACDAVGAVRPHVRLVLNGDEELGSPSSRTVIEEESLRGASVLVFEASANGALKTARKGVGIFRVEARGEAVHAGLDPEAGASAIEEISRVVLLLHAASDLAAGTTINVGVLRGGTRTNVKAGRAVAEVDVRVSSEAEAQRVDSLLGSLRAENPLASISVGGGWNRPVMQRTEKTAAMFSRAVDVATALDLDLQEASVGGASDGNFAAALGLPVLDGLGAVGAGAHARNEWISISGMVERAALAAGLLTRLV
ncbi:peptidase M20 [Sinomonas atrocyanea]|uniref:Peptidase M20 n=1 Tax=Sinomonas atrocyanea TaxID=37927 RepID=A0A127A0D2_9MICC|nr:M20 family metallopeptidase [Sinomonas atrocyanea]AMM32890.1 peptidase M20 [Sinomonas atrocyanea]GEB65009.1 peptidase M20 [Sinomonas atrocyanea]GGG61524.1 peptidase M20 [Sinomonas atrocyanea]